MWDNEGQSAPDALPLVPDPELGKTPVEYRYVSEWGAPDYVNRGPWVNGSVPADVHQAATVSHAAWKTALINAGLWAWVEGDALALVAEDQGQPQPLGFSAMDILEARRGADALLA